MRHLLPYPHLAQSSQGGQLRGPLASQLPALGEEGGSQRLPQLHSYEARALWKPRPHLIPELREDELWKDQVGREDRGRAQSTGPLSPQGLYAQRRSVF